MRFSLRGWVLAHSGVWRFRDLRPILDNSGNAVTLREGNTPLYWLSRAAKALGVEEFLDKGKDFERLPAILASMDVRH